LYPDGQLVGLSLSQTVISLHNFPFTAVTGQASFKLALCLAAINPAIGGVLVSGPRGSAKSTLARGLADVMVGANNDKVSFITLPLGATEEMLLGTLNLEQVLASKKTEFQPGLLAKANNGVLYVDEVNLLPDNLVDLLLDVSASGVNIVERDGISESHSARFVLLGTMNPDEGELRPQLQDRFGLSVELDNQYSVEDRVEIVRLREQFDMSSDEFLTAYKVQQEALAEKLSKAKSRLKKVTCDEPLRILIANKCQSANVDGLRADIVWYRAAAAHAVLNDRLEVIEEDVLAVENLVLNHRRNHTDTPPPPSNNKPFTKPSEQSVDTPAGGDWGAMDPQQQVTAKKISLSLPSRIQPNPSSVGAALSDAFVNRKGGGSAGVEAKKAQSKRINWFASLLVSAGQWPLAQLKFRPIKTGQSKLNIVLLDTSASTLHNELFAKAKAAILSIAEKAYLSRQQLTILGFGNSRVETLLPKKRAPKALRQLLDNIPAGGGTPLREVLQHALLFQQSELRKNPSLALNTIIITDGKSTQQFDDIELLGEVTLLDIENSPVKRGKGERIASVLGADYLLLPTY
jgi:magnesium chelatase subunit D